MRAHCSPLTPVYRCGKGREPKERQGKEAWKEGACGTRWDRVHFYSHRYQLCASGLSAVLYLSLLICKMGNSAHFRNSEPQLPLVSGAQDKNQKNLKRLLFLQLVCVGLNLPQPCRNTFHSPIHPGIIRVICSLAELFPGFKDEPSRRASEPVSATTGDSSEK